MQNDTEIIKRLIREGSLSRQDLVHFKGAAEVIAHEDISPAATNKVKTTGVILVTGGAGFIGSNFIHYMMEAHPEYKIINLDVLTYAGNLDNLIEVEKKYGTGALENERRYFFVKGDIRDADLVDKLVQKADMIVHFAAESHVDRSITDPQAFLSTNIFGTQVLLEAAKKHKTKKFLHISTDEVYGSTDTGYYSETDLLTPRSPYSASKASSDMLVKSYHTTFGVPVLITRTSNNFGPRQHPEKFIPLFITNFLEDKKVPVYGYGLNRRDWIYVEDNCRALDAVLHKGEIGEIYNIGTHVNEMPNIEMSMLMASLLGKSPSAIEFVADRKGHDFRYAINIEKTKALGWNHQYSLQVGLEKTIAWYKENEWWWKKVKGGEYQQYYKEQYQK